MRAVDKAFRSALVGMLYDVGEIQAVTVHAIVFVSRCVVALSPSGIPYVYGRKKRLPFASFELANAKGRAVSEAEDIPLIYGAIDRPLSPSDTSRLVARLLPAAHRLINSLR
jgi:hypothetical protein